MTPLTTRLAVGFFMHNAINKTVIALFSTMFAANVYATDSTLINAPSVAPKIQTYLLDYGWINTAVGNYMVDAMATNKRCKPSTTPAFMTNISSIQVYGRAQAIEGVQNTLQFNPLSYKVFGVVSAPVNVEARDNGVQLNWQIWCIAHETV